MVMLPEDVLITKNGSAVTSSDLLALNALAADNVRFELINKEGVKSGSNAAVNYFPSIKIGSDYFFTVESMDEAVESCNAQIRAVAEKKQNEGKPVVLAEINRVLEKSDLYDGVHPNEAG